VDFYIILKVPLLAR